MWGHARVAVTLPYILNIINFYTWGHARVAVTLPYILNIINFYTCIYIRMSVRNFVYSKDLEGSCGQYSVANCRCDVSAFDLRKSMW